MICDEKKRIETRNIQKQIKKHKNKKSALRNSNLLKKIIWGHATSVNRFLSHHLIQRRSFVFIVDTEYESITHRDLVFHELTRFYWTIHPEDYVGFIMLGENENQDITLEVKTNNEELKLLQLKAMKDKEPEFVLIGQSSVMSAHSRKNQLEKALRTAYMWQNTLVEDEDV